MKRLFFIFLSLILVCSIVVIPGFAVDPGQSRANLFPTTPLDVTLFDYVVYDVDNSWTTVAVGHGNTFTYTFQANKNYAIRFASPYLPSSLISPGSTVDYYIINLDCTASNYSSPTMNGACFYYNSGGSRITESIISYGAVNFDSLPVCNIPFRSDLNSSTFRFVTDFNYFKVSSTKSVSFTLNAFAYGESKGQPIIQADSYITGKLNDGTIVSDGYSFPKNFFITDQRAFSSNRFLQSGLSYTQFNISSSNLLNPPPNNSSSVDSAYDESGYNFIFYPLGHNFVYFSNLRSGMKVNFRSDISFTSNVDQWSRIVESSVFYLDYYDSNYKLLDTQAVLLSPADLSSSSVSFNVSFKTDMPIGTQYVQFYVKTSGWCPLNWNSSGYIKFKLNSFEFYLGELIGNDVFVDNSDIEDMLSGELGAGFDTIFSLQDTVLEFIAQFSSAFRFFGIVFDALVQIPLLKFLLYLSISLGVFGVLLNFTVQALSKNGNNARSSPPRSKEP